MEAFKVGGEVDAWCTTCKTMKWHVIVAMLGAKPAKVECNGCHKQHAFRPSEPGPKPVRAAKPRSTAVPPPAPPVDDLEAKLSGRADDARTYSPSDRYAVEEVVRHPTFGLGLVVGVPGAQKVEVAFRGGRKLLLHDREHAHAPSLERPPRRDESGPTPITDAPPGDKEV